jgi:hypothetical protein
MAITQVEYELIVDWLDGDLKDGSPKEIEARRHLARALRDGSLTLGMRVGLANLIDPEDRKWMKRSLVFKRPAGARATVDHLKVATIIWHERKAGRQMKSAVSIAMEKCGMRSRDKALAAYKEYRPFLETVGDRMKALRELD